MVDVIGATKTPGTSNLGHLEDIPKLHRGQNYRNHESTIQSIKQSKMVACFMEIKGFACFHL